MLFVAVGRNNDGEEKESSLIEECVLRCTDDEENVFVVAVGWIGIHWEKELSALRSDDDDDEDEDEDDGNDDGIFFVPAK